jgi:hypothetical protein
MRRIFLFFVVVLFVTGSVFAENLIDLEIELSSDEIYFADTLFIAIYAKNVSGKLINNFPAFGTHPVDLSCPEFFDYFKIYLSHANDKAIYHFYQDRLSKWYYIDVKHACPIKQISLNPDEKVRIGIVLFKLPTLDNIKDPFWSRVIKEPPKDNDKFILNVEGTFKKDNITYFDGMICHKLKINPRSKESMKIITDWYKNSSPKLYEISSEFPSVKFISGKFLSENYNFYKEDGRIQIGKIPAIPWRFRYELISYYPPEHLGPTTWEDWKKLEESFEKGTLKDKIRFTRICVQYYTTADEKVLDELKSWLEKMNPLQRTIIVNINYSQRHNDLPNYQKFNEVIQSFKDKK